MATYENVFYETYMATYEKKYVWQSYEKVCGNFMNKVCGNFMKKVHDNCVKFYGNQRPQEPCGGWITASTGHANRRTAGECAS